MPESVRDRVTQSHEYVFLLAKDKRYFYDQEAVKEPLACPDAADGSRVFGGKNKHGANIDHGDRTTGRVYDSTPSGRNLRSVWTVNPKPLKEAHFATFPPALIAPMILAGTSSYGCCLACGAPWERVVEKTGEVDASAKGSRFDQGKTAAHQQGRAQNGERYTNRTLGWRPTCDCSGLSIIGDQPRKPSKRKGQTESEHEAALALWKAEMDEWWQLWNKLEPLYEAEPKVPAIVLDPFMGSGTAALVALEHGRHFLGIELNPEYIDMANKRIEVVQPRLL